jgi:glycosyltransferase involved in cell wall biosynthesis
MLSIIICSRTQTISTDLSENINKTIGCEYELIVIDNSENKHSIFEAYNLGIDQSKGRYLCFMHDDIFIHSYSWGNIIKKVFQSDEKTGLIGVAGAKVKTKMPSAWWDCPGDQKVIHIIQHYPNQEKEIVKLGFGKEKNIEAVAIDGVFMAMRKDNRIHFNTKMTGFHNYDLNISFEYKKHGYKIIVTNEILIEHFSLGTINEAWVSSTFKVHSLYQSILPLRFPESLINRETEITNGIRFIKESLKYKNNRVACLVWIKFFYWNPVSKYHIRFWKTIIKNYLN